jgi:hypothetical protein
MSDDGPNPPHTTADIEWLAEGWRKALDPEDSWAPDIMTLIENAGREFKAVHGLKVAFLPDKEMGDDEARTEFEPLRICVRQSLQVDAINNVPRLRSTLAHELGHAVLHSGMPKSRKEPGNGKIAYLTAFKLQESQAWLFARAFLMPSWKVEQVTSALALSLRCRVSSEMAEIRFAHAPRRALSRPEPAGVRAAIDKLRSTSPHPVEDTRIKAERDRIKAWARARHIEDQDPSRAPRSDDAGTGYRIEWRHYGNALSPFGWFVEDGRALAYFAKDR